MTARRLLPDELPDWPRWLTAELAAAYVGVGLNQFRDEIKAGLWPSKHPTLRRWDRQAIDAASDRLSNPAIGPTKEDLRRRIRGDAQDADTVPA